MKINGKKTNRQIQLRRWTKKQLTKDDFIFAVSSRKDAWTSLSHQLWQCNRRAAKKVVADMCHWEILREFKGNTCSPFCAVNEHQERIRNVLNMATLPKPSEIEPLKEIRLADVIKRDDELTQGVRSGTSVHAFEIDRDDRTETTVQRFHNWLVSYKQTPDCRNWFAAVKRDLGRLGRQSLDAELRAIAVRRLKLAGYSREETELKLGLKRYALASPTDFWSKLPALAEREIRRYEPWLRKFSEV